MLNISLPPIAALDAAAAHLVEQSADASHERALNKALWHLQSGLEIRSTCGGFLMPSGTRAGVIHRISHTFGCNCEAALNGHVCWHASAVAIVVEAQRYTMPSLITMPEGDTLDTDGMRVARPTVAKMIAAARAKLDMDELFA